MELPTFSHPEHLLALLLLPLLYWLSRPVRPRLSVATPHLAQWRRALARVRKRPLRLRWLRLLLLMLAFAAAAAAFSGPTIGARDGPRELVVLLDRSASMAASGAWESAQSELQAQLSRLPEDVEVRLALCGAAVERRQGLREEILASLGSPSGVGSIDFDALVQATASADVAVWTITDGLGPAVAPASGALTLVGAPVDNVAITDLQVVDAWPLPRVALRLRIDNFSRGSRSVLLAVDGVVHADVRLDLAAGAHVEQVLEVQRGAGGAVRVFLRDGADGLAADDEVSVQLPPPPPGDIAVLSDAEAGPEIGVAAAALAEECGGRVVAAATETAGFLLVEGGRLPGGGKGERSLTFGTRFSNVPLAASDLRTDPAVLDWDRDDPVTAGLDLSELVVRTALRAEHLPPGTSLVSGTDGPLVVRVDNAGGSTVHTAFRLSESNFALLPAFPQFLRRAYLASWRGSAQPVSSPHNLVSQAESDLRARSRAPAPRPLPAFGRPGRSLAVLLLALALGALVARLYA